MIKKRFVNIMFWSFFISVSISLIHSLSIRCDKIDESICPPIAMNRNNAIFIDESCTWQSLMNAAASICANGDIDPSVDNTVVQNKMEDQIICMVTNMNKYGKFNWDISREYQRRIFLYITEHGFYLQKLWISYEGKIFGACPDVLYYDINKFHDVLSYLNDEPYMMIELCADEHFNVFHHWKLFYNLFNAVDYERIITCCATGLMTPEATSGTMHHMFRKEVICRLFNAKICELGEVEWRLDNMESKSQVINEDGVPVQQYRIEGAFRILYTLPYAGIDATPDGYEQYTKTTINDWKQNDNFQQTILKEAHTGEVFFSPSTGWIYFKAKLKHPTIQINRLR